MEIPIVNPVKKPMDGRMGTVMMDGCNGSNGSDGCDGCDECSACEGYGGYDGRLNHSRENGKGSFDFLVIE